MKKIVSISMAAAMSVLSLTASLPMMVSADDCIVQSEFDSETMQTVILNADESDSVSYLIHNTFDFNGENSYQTRGPLYLLAGRFDPDGNQPIRFSAPKLFWSRKGGNSFYTSYTVVDGTGVLWFPDRKYRLYGRKIGAEWFE